MFDILAPLKNKEDRRAIKSVRIVFRKVYKFTPRNLKNSECLVMKKQQLLDYYFAISEIVTPFAPSGSILKKKKDATFEVVAKPFKKNEIIQMLGEIEKSNKALYSFLTEQLKTKDSDGNTILDHGRSILLGVGNTVVHRRAGLKWQGIISQKQLDHMSPPIAIAILVFLTYLEKGPQIRPSEPKHYVRACLFWCVGIVSMFFIFIWNKLPNLYQKEEGKKASRKSEQKKLKKNTNWRKKPKTQEYLKKLLKAAENNDNPNQIQEAKSIQTDIECTRMDIAEKAYEDGILCKKNRHYKEAYKNFKKAASFFPNEAGYNLQAGIMCSKLYEDPEKEQYLTAGIKHLTVALENVDDKGKDREWSYLFRGICYNYLSTEEDLKKAEQDFTNVIKMNKNQVFALWHRGCIYYKAQNEFLKAAIDFKKITNLNKKDADHFKAFNMIARCYLKMGETKLAESYVRKALKHKKKDKTISKESNNILNEIREAKRSTLPQKTTGTTSKNTITSPREKEGQVARQFERKNDASFKKISKKAGKILTAIKDIEKAIKLPEEENSIALTTAKFNRNTTSSSAKTTLSRQIKPKEEFPTKPPQTDTTTEQGNHSEGAISNVKEPLIARPPRQKLTNKLATKIKGHQPELRNNQTTGTTNKSTVVAKGKTTPKENKNQKGILLFHSKPPKESDIPPKKPTSELPPSMCIGIFNKRYNDTMALLKHMEIYLEARIQLKKAHERLSERIELESTASDLDLRILENAENELEDIHSKIKEEHNCITTGTVFDAAKLINIVEYIKVSLVLTTHKLKTVVKNLEKHSQKLNGIRSLNMVL